MTYFYLFEAKDYVYCGQHRCTNNKDPMKDCYKGSGKKWVEYLKENGWWKIKDFRSNVKKTILEIVMDDENRQTIGNVEKYWIDWTRKTYGEKCINISKGSEPNSFYETIEETEEAKKRTYKRYHNFHKEERNAYNRLYNETHKEERKAYNRLYNETHKEERKAYQKAYDKLYNETHKEERKAYQEKYRKENKDMLKDYFKKYDSTPKRKQRDKVRSLLKRNNYQDPLLAKFPKTWNSEDKQEYIRQYNIHKA